jgi:Ca2+-binding RTX toxin-like protein
MARRLRLAAAVALLTLICAGSLAEAATRAPGARPHATSTTTTSTTSTSTTSTTSAPVLNTATTASLFGCQATVAPVELLGIGVPLGQANPNASGAPCADGTATVGSTNLTLGTTNLGSVGPAGAYTFVTGAPGSATAPAVASVADVSAINLNLGSAGTLQVVGPVESVASYSCQNNAVTSFAQSTLDVINVNGTNETLPKPGEQATYALPGSGNYVVVNEQIATGTTLTENVLDIHLGSLNTSVVVGQAEVSQSVSNPCANTAGGSVSTTITNSTRYVQSQECQSGTLLDTKTDDCVLLADGQVIYVSQAGKSPTGGTVISVADAKKKYHSACLSGSGPKWVLIISKAHAHAVGTPGPDRIIGTRVDNWASGLSGNDCIDLQGGGTSQHLNDANGNDRGYVLKGTERIIEGNGNDLINAERSGGWLTIGNGRDKIYGGSGRSRIDLGRGVKHLKTGRGYSRVYYVGSTAQISCGSKKDLLYLRVAPRRYALAHGCPIKTTHSL